MEVTGNNQEVTAASSYQPKHDRNELFRPRHPRARPSPARRDPNPRGLRLPRGPVPKVRAPPQELLAARVARQARLDAGELPDFLPETRADPGGLVVGRIDPGRPPGPPHRDHGTRGPQDGDQRAQFGGQGVHGRLRGRDLPHLGEPARRPRQPEGRGPAHDLVHKPRGKVIQAGREDGDPPRAPRGWHLPEKHVHLDGLPVSGSLFDFGLYFFHNAKELLARGSGPYFYLPKMESHLEARLWNDVFIHAQAALGIPQGSVRATSLIETILATFEAEEILFELRDHSSGLNCGRWDYIFSCIKKFQAAAELRLSRPDPGHDDGAVHAGLLPVRHQGVPPPRRPCHGRNGGPDPDQERPCGERRGAGEGARRQGARGHGRPRRHLGGAPGPCPRCAQGVRQAHARAPTRSPASART
jgi:hypothetical protein